MVKYSPSAHSMLAFPFLEMLRCVSDHLCLAHSPPKQANCKPFNPPSTVQLIRCSSDFLIGDNFLRSVYAIYDFGDFDSTGAMGNPFMQMLSIIDPDQASVEFHNARGGSPNTNITYVGLSGTAIQPVYALSQDVTNSIETISKLVPVLLAVVAFNALVLVALIIGGIVYLCRRRRKKNNPRARLSRGRQSPMPMNPVNSYIAGVEALQQPHRYEPVSMALTEDTLYGPPSPAFHKFDNGAGSSMDRPKSYA